MDELNFLHQNSSVQSGSVAALWSWASQTHDNVSLKRVA
jgi:hypothetical protein